MLVHVLEDDPGVSDSLQLLLEQVGHEVRLYPTAEAFFHSGKPKPDDLVLVDLGLPDASGADVIDWMGELPVAPRIVAISGQSRLAIESQLGIANRLPLLRKPLNEDALLACL